MPRASAPDLRGAALVLAVAFAMPAGCAPSDAGSVDLAASKSAASRNNQPAPGGPSGRSAGPARGKAAPRSAPARPASR